MMEFVYKDKQYTWDEWTADNNRFIEELELPDDFRIDINIREFSLLHDIGYAIAIDKFLELYSMIASARSALLNAFQKFFDSNIISWDSGYKGQLWMRFNYLKNAIVWYNSCEDYILQIIWFAYDMYPELITSEEIYLNDLKKCNFNKIINVLNGLEDINENAKILKQKVSEYRNDIDIYTLREELANNLKHRANVQVRGFEDLRTMGFIIKSRGGNEIFNSKWIEPKLVDIDDTIELLKRVHVKLITLGRFILNFMNLDNVFAIDENGDRILNEIRKKSDYKKIDLSRNKKYI